MMEEPEAVQCFFCLAAGDGQCRDAATQTAFEDVVMTVLEEEVDALQRQRARLRSPILWWSLARRHIGTPPNRVPKAPASGWGFGDVVWGGRSWVAASQHVFRNRTDRQNRVPPISPPPISLPLVAGRSGL